MIRKHLFAVAALALVATAGVAVAQDVVAARQDLMKKNGKEMGAIKAVLVDKQGSLGDVVANADSIAADSAKIPELFPAGSDMGETRALPIIWEKPDEFAAKAKNTADLAMALSAAAKSGDEAAALAAFGALGKDGCGGCHATFQKPKG
jgi:cytochrome c556